MSGEFRDITIIANPARTEVRDGSGRHAKKFPFRLSAAPDPEWVAILDREWSTFNFGSRSAGAPEPKPSLHTVPTEAHFDSKLLLTLPGGRGRATCP